MTSEYVMPQDGSWIPVKIISAQIEKRAIRIKQGNEFRSVEVDTYELQLVHAETTYGTRPFPYRIFTPVEDVWCPLKNPVGNRDSFQITNGNKLRKATGATRPEDMVGAVVMAQVRILHKVMRGQDDVYLDALHNWTRPMPDRNIRVVTARGVMDAVITWGSINALMVDEIQAGAEARAQIETGEFMDICWINNRWEELGTDVRVQGRSL